MDKLSERMAWAIENCVDSWSELEEEAIKEGIDRLAYYEDLEEQSERENSNKLQQESIKINAGKKEELIELLSGYSLDTYEDIVYTAERLIEHGVEIPVRCKDCKHVRKMIGKSYHYCVTHNTKMHADDFCSYGEKRCDDAN